MPDVTGRQVPCTLPACKDLQQTVWAVTEATERPAGTRTASILACRHTASLQRPLEARQCPISSFTGGGAVVGTRLRWPQCPGRGGAQCLGVTQRGHGLHCGWSHRGSQSAGSCTCLPACRQARDHRRAPCVAENTEEGSGFEGSAGKNKDVGRSTDKRATAHQLAIPYTSPPQHMPKCLCTCHHSCPACTSQNPPWWDPCDKPEHRPPAKEHLWHGVDVGWADDSLRYHCAAPQPDSPSRGLAKAKNNPESRGTGTQQPDCFTNAADLRRGDRLTVQERRCTTRK